MKPLKIAIVVHGRFHAFNLARALLERGHDVTIFTNYPKWAVERFHFPGDRVRSFWVHGVLTRGAQKLDPKNIVRYREEWFHAMFGRWAAAQFRKEAWDVVHIWSGVAEELLRAMPGCDTLRMVMRGSAHIRVQAKLLEEEQCRTGAPQDHPSPWIIAREQREYALADRVLVLSSFAYRSFIEKGLRREKLVLLPLGAELNAFRPSREIVDARCRRILSGEPLRVLYVGALSFRKGIWDMRSIVRTVGNRFRFRFVGALMPEAKQVAAEIHQYAEIYSYRPQEKLPECYAWGDLFLFPTIEDGFAVVLTQACAGALPILTTTNCSGPDFLRDGENGWVLPIRCPESFIERLRWCNSHREELAAMVWRIYSDFRPRDWSDVAADFEAICFQGLKSKRLEGLEPSSARGRDISRTYFPSS